MVKFGISVAFKRIFHYLLNNSSKLTNQSTIVIWSCDTCRHRTAFIYMTPRTTCLNRFHIYQLPITYFTVHAIKISSWFWEIFFAHIYFFIAKFFLFFTLCLFATMCLEKTHHFFEMNSKIFLITLILFLSIKYFFSSHIGFFHLVIHFVFKWK